MNLEPENSPLFKENNILPEQNLHWHWLFQKNRIVCVGVSKKKRSLSFDFLPPGNGRFSQPPRLPFPAFHLRFRPERSTPNNGQRTTPTVFHGWFGRKAVEWRVVRVVGRDTRVFTTSINASKSTNVGKWFQTLLHHFTILMSCFWSYHILIIAEMVKKYCDSQHYESLNRDVGAYLVAAGSNGMSNAIFPASNISGNEHTSRPSRTVPWKSSFFRTEWRVMTSGWHQCLGKTGCNPCISIGYWT